MNRFDMSVMVDGVELKIGNDRIVELPFGAEYSLKLTNNHPTQRAVCKLFIDGKEQSKMGYCIMPRSSRIIERNSHSPNKLLFVCQTSLAAQDAGHDPENKDKNNGVVEGRFYLEKERKTEAGIHHKLRGVSLSNFSDNVIRRLKTGPCGSSAQSSILNASMPASMLCHKPSEITPGVTVAGSKSSVIYRKVNIDLEDQYTIVTFIMRGKAS